MKNKFAYGVDLGWVTQLEAQGIRWVDEDHKEIDPECMVVTHVAGLPMPEWTEPFLDTFFEQGGRTDVLGLSHYPFMMKDHDPGETKESILAYLEGYKSKYGKPVIIAEIGGPDDDEKGTWELLDAAIRALKEVSDVSKDYIASFKTNDPFYNGYVPEQRTAGDTREI